MSEFELRVTGLRRRRKGCEAQKGFPLKRVTKENDTENKVFLMHEGERELQRANQILCSNIGKGATPRWVLENTEMEIHHGSVLERPSTKQYKTALWCISMVPHLF